VLVENQKEALVRGEFDRGKAARITHLPERTARRVLNDVLAKGLLASSTEKGPVSLRFPTESLETLFPRLMCRPSELAVWRKRWESNPASEIVACKWATAHVKSVRDKFQNSRDAWIFGFER
jgi:hypothetical protein